MVGLPNIYAIVHQIQKIKPSFYSLHYAEACNERQGLTLNAVAAASAASIVSRNFVVKNPPQMNINFKLNSS